MSFDSGQGNEQNIINDNNSSNILFCDEKGNEFVHSNSWKDVDWTPSAEAKKAYKELYASKDLVYYVPKEEMTNTVTHALGVPFGLIAMVITMLAARESVHYFLAVIFGVCFVLLYGTSALYHGLRVLEIKKHVRKMDHGSVILPIIASGMPLVMAVPASTFNYVVMAVCIVLTVISYFTCVYNFMKFRNLILIIDTIMGVVFTAAYVVNRQYIGYVSRMLYLAGFIMSVAGLILYKIKKPYVHAVFHVIVLLGPILCFAAGYLMVTGAGLA